MPTNASVSTTARMQGVFCGDCLFMRYGENVDEALADPDWKCFHCRCAAMTGRRQVSCKELFSRRRVRVRNNGCKPGLHVQSMGSCHTGDFDRALPRHGLESSIELWILVQIPVSRKFSEKLLIREYMIKYLG